MILFNNNENDQPIVQTYNFLLPNTFVKKPLEIIHQLCRHIHELFINSKYSEMQRYFSLGLLPYLLVVGACLYQKAIPSSNSSLCLDGSPAAIFVSPGDPLKIMIHFQSGGWCGEADLSTTIQGCYNRSLTNLGSSKYLLDTMTFSSGILSDNQANSFSNWTRVFFNYCDGSGHQGTRLEPISFKGKKIYFRGANITMERFEYLQKHYGLYTKANQIIISGSSAGGLATYFWTNYLASKIKNGHLQAIACSGIFLDAVNIKTSDRLYRQKFENLMKLSNQQIAPPVQECNKQYANQLVECMLAHNLIEFISVPLFIVQSLYDLWSISNILGIECSNKYQLSSCSEEERRIIEEYHVNTSKVVEKGRQKSAKLNGYWANGCVYHGYIFFSAYYSPNFRIPENTQNSIDHVLLQWQKQTHLNHFYQDQAKWPSNLPCSNTRIQPEIINYTHIQTRNHQIQTGKQPFNHFLIQI